MKTGSHNIEETACLRLRKSRISLALLKRKNHKKKDICKARLVTTDATNAYKKKCHVKKINYK